MLQSRLECKLAENQPCAVSLAVLPLGILGISLLAPVCYWVTAHNSSRAAEQQDKCFFIDSHSFGLPGRLLQTLHYFGQPSEAKDNTDANPRVLRSGE